jgi:hypothetical protein
MTTSTLDREYAFRAAEIAVAAVGFQFGLARLLAHAVESGTRREDRELVPQPRAATPAS